MTPSSKKALALYISKNDRQLGPFTLARVQRMVAVGSLKPDDLAWYEGLLEWIPIDQIPGFSDPKVRPPRPNEKRPPMLWLILVWYCLDLLGSLVSGGYAIRLGYVHLDAPLWPGLYVLCLLVKILILICLFLMSDRALRLIPLFLALSTIWNIHSVGVWSPYMTQLGLVVEYLALVLFYTVNIVLLYLVWQMAREDVLH